VSDSTHTLIFGVKINYLFGYSSIILSEILLFKKVLEMIVDAIRRLYENPVNKYFEISYRWVSLSAWSLVATRIILYNKQQFKPILGTLIRVFYCVFVSSLSFVVLSISLIFFYESFLKKTLKNKIIDVSKTEKIVSALKQFKYSFKDIESSSDDADYIKVHCCGVDHEAEIKDNFYATGNDEIDLNWALLKKPELESINHAKRLAMDCFTKISEDRLEELDFNTFMEMFTSSKIGIEAFKYFDVNSDQTVSKREFRDTLISFFINRGNLQKSFEVTKSFIDYLSNILTIICLGLLILVYLVIFGVSLKDLAALALSSALLINFSLSGMATDLYANITLLLSHPYDIGDEILIGDTPYYVQKIGLSSTSFIAENGSIVKIVNSELAKAKIYNLTKAPEQLLAFNFVLAPTTKIQSFKYLKKYIRQYLNDKRYDYYEDYTIKTTSEKSVSLDKLECTIILKNKSYKTRSKRFYMRAEFISYINQLLDELKITMIN